MKLETGKITASQLMFSITCFIQSSSLLTSFVVGVTEHDSWIVVLIGMLVFLPELFIYLALLKTFPGKNLMEICELTYGKVLGKIVSTGFLLFFLTLATLNLRDLSVFVKQTIMPKTPDAVIMACCVLVGSWAVRYGLQTVVRYSFFFILISMVVLGASLLLVGNQMHFESFLPMFELPPVKYIQGTHIILTIPFGEIVVFMMIAPHTDTRNKSHLRYILNGFLLGGFLLLMVVVRDTAVLGNALHLFTLPAFETLRLATLVERLSRMEIMFAVVLIILLFFKITVLHYATTISTAQIFGMKSYRPLALTIGALMIAYSFTLYPSSIEHAYTGQETIPFAWTFFEALLPLVTLIVAKIRRLAAKGAEG